MGEEEELLNGVTELCPRTWGEAVLVENEDRTSCKYWNSGPSGQP